MVPPQPIAIVGIGGVFPGSPTPEALWQNVLAARDLSRPVPAGRWPLAVEDLYSPTPAPDKVYSNRGCFVEGFSPDFTGLPFPRELLTGLDPMFHLLLAAGRTAWDDAVTTNVDRSRVGIVVGNIALPTDASSALTDEIFRPLFESRLFHRVPQAQTQLTHPLNRYVAGLPAGLLAAALELGGGSYTLDAACASSLYALKLAIDELQSHRADVMLTGGVSRPDCLYTQMGFSQLKALSPSGRCAPFDAAADGLVVGEGSGILVLKRLRDALRDGDRIYATLAGVGLSNDIGGNLMHPESTGQLRAMRSAYSQASWNPRDLDLIECHGTGTPIGDGVEFNSLSQLWGSGPRQRSRCVIGSVKSNVGHLLTAAGASGLIKVLLALRDRTLPPTANFHSPAAGVDLADGPFTVLREPQEWPSRNGASRRAAVSAFGFGGINAHVLLEEWREPMNGAVAVPAMPPPQPPPAVAIVGLGAHFGPWDSLNAFADRVLGAGDSIEPTEPPHWYGVPDASRFRGFFIDEVRIPVGRFRIPPTELADMLPQQLLMLQVAADAMADAKLDGELPERLDTGVFIGIGLDLNTTQFRFRWKLLNDARKWVRELGREASEVEIADWADRLRDSAGPPLTANRTMGALGGIVASRVARAFHVGGPSFTISNEEASGLRALEVGVRALQRGELNVALVGAVDLAGDVRAALGDDAAGAITASELLGEGAAAVVLKRYDDALRDGDRIYAVIRDIRAASGPLSLGAPGERARVRGSCLSDTLLESRPPLPRSTEGEGVRSDPVTLDAAADVGHTGAASGLASLVKVALALSHELLPTTGATRYWLRNRTAGPRRAVVSQSSVDGNDLRAELESPAACPQRMGLPRRAGCGAALFIVSCASAADLSIALAQLHELATSVGPDVHALARRWWGDARSAGASSGTETGSASVPLTVAIIASDPDELRQAIRQADQCVRRGESIAGPSVFHCATPLGGGGIAFVFPGAGNAFADMGGELAAAFPEVLRKQDGENERLAAQFAGGRYWEGRSADVSHRDEIFAQVSLGAMVTDLLAAFGVKPSAAIGYSLGETTAFFATRAWTGRDEMLGRLERSTLFTSDLTGRCDAARRTWGLSAAEEVDWRVVVIDRSVETVREALRGRDRVYLLIVNTANECVVGGDARAVDALVSDLGCRAHSVPGVTTVHCEVARPIEEPYRDLHLLETNPPPGVRFYSGAAGMAYDVTRESAAESIVAQAVAPFDFSRVIRAAYADGARIFIEVGPGSSCTRMIAQILEGEPHWAGSVCPKIDPLLGFREREKNSCVAQSAVTALLKVLASLAVEGVPINLGMLYGGQETPAVSRIERCVSVPIGGRPFPIPPPPGRSRESKTAPQTSGKSANRDTGVSPVRVARDVGEPNRLIARAGGTPVSRAPLAEPQSATCGVALLPMIEQMATSQIAQAAAQETFLRFARNNTAALGNLLSFQMELMASADPATLLPTALQSVPCQIALDREQCIEYAIGSIAEVLGPAFAKVDSYPTRVRLPDEPLMLVDRIVAIEGEANSMSRGRVVTEHDIHDGAWYLDCGRIPTCIAVEAGQADLFLSGYLGIDSLTKGQAVYRLLDAVVTFHHPLPGPGERIVYDIAIDEFFFQGKTCLFRFRFDATVNGELLLTMRKGCAGFFTEAELAAGQGIVQTSIDLRPMPGARPPDWVELTPMVVESYTDAHLELLRQGDLASCFGAGFAGLELQQPVTLPGGRMTLVDRVIKLDPTGGRYGMGQIIAEADIHPDDWFLTCHFVDDRVMPGTLMYECCLHTLRIFLLRMGWVGETGAVAYEPMPGVASQLKCRGQVTESTRKVRYEVTIKEIGYEVDGTPFALADSLMFADGKPIVQTPNMSVRLSGLTRGTIEKMWSDSLSLGTPGEREPVAPLFNTDRITAFAIGNPSDAFGDRYRIFDRERKIARLPGPPYQFLDRITSIEGCEPWKLAAGGVIEAEYDVPADAWYFAAAEQSHFGSEMPFAVLLEVALQPCGWLAAYLGSALVSDVDLSFRNLGGGAVQSLAVLPDTGTLTTRIKITSVSHSGGMIIQHFDLAVRSTAGEVYRGTTYFGFFAKEALRNQVGIREAVVYEPTAAEVARGKHFEYPTAAPFPGEMMRMVDRIDLYDPIGGPSGLGFICGSTAVDPSAWFFKAHFFEDPVWPGSLGLESFLQLLKVVAWERWGGAVSARSRVKFRTIPRGQKHSWVYRGQIIPGDQGVTVQAVVKQVDDISRTVRADGFLIVDGRAIYQMTDFALTMDVE